MLNNPFIVFAILILGLIALACVVLLIALDASKSSDQAQDEYYKGIKGSDMEEVDVKIGDNVEYVHCSNMLTGVVLKKKLFTGYWYLVTYQVVGAESTYYTTWVSEKDIIFVIVNNKK